MVRDPSQPTGAEPTSPAPTGAEPTSAEPTSPASTSADPARGQAAERPRRPSLSPSRAADFKTCPLLFRFRTIDRLPEQPTADQARGTLVHAVLERLFDLPAADRTPERAAELVAPEWERLRAANAELAGLFSPDAAAPAMPPAGEAPAGAPPKGATAAEFLASATDLLAGYFTMEDPRRLEPAERETLIEATIGDELLIRGYVDRLDISPAGDMRVVDYKTGGAPREAFEARALFQLKFYALVLWRIHGVVPRVLRLLYLRDAEVCDYTPDLDELLRFERTLLALWQAIERATQTGDFRPKPSRLCGWCAHQAHCPEFGGSPPPYPAIALAPGVPAPAGED
ncbi:recombinase RecB [Planosporangium flavigriseum]|uniref:Exonuclease RecB n=2 Tax=Planosporangium flavigriseum TaxID=373681 RepID=A0A8J3LWP4_9ACTN|nr:recombinase RecB [Planosporangium flavigriseum]GIG74740.1 exonuclease RecB [Planosporangium flavigriseum]